MTAWPMKLLYDGDCPVCRREIDWLRRRNRDLRLTFENIAAPGFDAGRYGLTREEVNASLHGVMADGSLARGAEAVRRAYEAVGLGWLVAPTRLPGVRALTNASYRLFARNRLWLGGLLGRRCSPDTGCSLDVR